MVEYLPSMHRTLGLTSAQEKKTGGKGRRNGGVEEGKEGEMESGGRK